MITINAYKYARQSGAISYVLFRYAVISAVYGIKLPTELEIKRFSEKAMEALQTEEHTEIADRLIFLYGAGIISEETATNLIENGRTDIEEDIIAAENAVFAGEGQDPQDRLTYAQIENILLCSANSKMYPEMQRISFAEARVIAGLPHIALVNGMTKISDKDFFKFLVDFGEQFGTLTDENQIRIEDVKENLLNCEDVQNGEINSKYYPFAINLRRIMRYASVFDKLYGKDFILYARENGLPVDKNFIGKYEEYVREIKLHFTVKSYTRKRYICGDKINWFDYTLSSEAIAEKNLNADYTKEIDLDISENYSDTELVSRAALKFRNIVALPENAVIEVFHSNKKYLYILRNSEICELDSEKFHTMLFDFDKIWSIIQLCTRSHKIKVMDGKISIPEALMNEIAPNEREYAERIIKEQYQRMKEQRKNNKLIQTLSEIKAAAEAERAKMNEQQAVVDQKKQEIADKKATRGSSTEG